MKTRLVTHDGKSKTYSSQQGRFEASSEMPCLRCGVCCTKWQPLLSREEVAAVANGLGIPLEVFYRDHLEAYPVKPDSYVFRRTGGACAYLAHDKGVAVCTIHPFRPQACRNWKPDLSRPECRQGLKQRSEGDLLLLPGRLGVSAEQLSRWYAALAQQTGDGVGEVGGEQMREPKTLIPKAQIERRIAELAAQIAADYQGKRPLLIGVLKGSFVFMADLVRALNMPLQVEFVRLSSYGAGIQSAGEVRMARTLSAPIRGRDVLVVEDIVDTGLTLKYLLEYLRRKKPASLKVCALLDKPSRRKTELHIDYLGFTVENVFIVGYGIDWDERYRYLPDICYIEEN